MHTDLYKPLPREFYTRKDVVLIARELIGKVLYTDIKGEISAGVITETEAYAGIVDKASHAYNNLRTKRTEVMYKNGGHVYVYLCYGVHFLFNIVTSIELDPQAVLIRGIEPFSGIELMKRRAGKSVLNVRDSNGPGKVSKLLGMDVDHSGVDMCSNSTDERKIWLQDENIKIQDHEIKIGSRIGIGYAEEDAFLPYRFERYINSKSSYSGAF